MTLTATQIEARKRGLGGSDAPVVLGISPWKTPLDLYLEKTGQVMRPDEPSDAMRWGSMLEPLIVQQFTADTGLKVRRTKKTFASKAHPYMVGHVDGLIVGERAGLECKMVTPRGEGDFGDGPEDVPQHYLAQVAHYSIVTGLPKFYVAALFLSKMQLRVYELTIDPELARMIVEAERHFWNQVVNRFPPAPHNYADVPKRWPRDSGITVEADAATLHHVERLRTLRAQKGHIENEITEAQAAVLSFMKEAATLTDLGGEVLATWKSAKDSVKFNAKRFEAEHPDLARPYLETVPGSRRFLLK